MITKLCLKQNYNNPIIVNIQQLTLTMTCFNDKGRRRCSAWGLRQASTYTMVYANTHTCSAGLLGHFDAKLNSFCIIFL